MELNKFISLDEAAPRFGYYILLIFFDRQFSFNRTVRGRWQLLGSFLPDVSNSYYKKAPIKTVREHCFCRPGKDQSAKFDNENPGFDAGSWQRPFG
jgi:hypothetical protein